jgi:hypothetical protein
MRLVGLPLLVLLAILAGDVAAAPAASARSASRMTLKVGRPVLWSPGYGCTMIVCDDTSVVRV